MSEDGVFFAPVEPRKGILADKPRPAYHQPRKSVWRSHRLLCSSGVIGLLLSPSISLGHHHKPVQLNLLPHTSKDFSIKTRVS